ncbi:hypothetical protein [Candidatus Nitrosacidococcus tergens]|uniref:Secreted protein n=1 Tax=Candidatus Nitrosacidococcus tergens TaxID=553981 RepID=A0A7G1Q8L5_9GAMM|nr:hypothetical protein [Candidatus Nitrosacidococcus tergens]CAB1275094.1 conserved exported protein of unknown function [Candidatus Nitrosacidococcus tergens]
MMKKTILFFSGLILYSISLIAIAHTTITAAGVEGTTLYTADVINHGCESGVKSKLPVIAESMVFPNGSDAVATVLPSSEVGAFTATTPGQPIDITSVITGGALTIVPTGMQDKNLFDIHEVQTDANGNVRGFHYSNSDTTPQGQDGELQLDLVGTIPFRLAGVSFQPTSCATQLNIRIGIVDWCTHKTGNRRNNIWIGNTTPTFNQTDRIATGTLGFWPTLIITRDLKNNPLPSSCGDGQVVAIQPSDDAIDTYLPMDGFTP